MEHELYYMQELKAPPGYQLEDTKHWFCFCDKDSSVTYCAECEQVIADSGAQRIPDKEKGEFTAANELMKYSLPATGGSGIYPLVMLSVTFIVTPLVYGFISRRKQERRGDG